MKSSTSYATAAARSFLFVGDPKTGKSNLLFAFPDLWVLDVDRNLVSAIRRAPTKKFFFDDPYTDAAGNIISDDIRAIKDKTSTRWARAITLLTEATKSPEIKTIAIDSLGGFSDLLINHLMFCALKEEGKSLDRLRIQDYQPLKTLVTQLVMALRNSGKTIIFTSHQKTDKDELTGRVRYTLNMPGALNENFGGFFTDVWATNASNIGGKLKYEILTRPSGFHVALGTSTDLPAIIDVTDKTPEQIWTIIGPKIA